MNIYIPPIAIHYMRAWDCHAINEAGTGIIVSEVCLWQSYYWNLVKSFRINMKITEQKRLTYLFLPSYPHEFLLNCILPHNKLQIYTIYSLFVFFFLKFQTNKEFLTHLQQLQSSTREDLISHKDMNQN